MKNATGSIRRLIGKTGAIAGWVATQKAMIAGDEPSRYAPRTSIGPDANPTDSTKPRQAAQFACSAMTEHRDRNLSGTSPKLYESVI